MASKTSVCHGLPSCLEPLMLQKRVLIQRLIPSKHAENPNKWDSIQLTNEREQVYVHPLDKSSTFSLSPMSLEMCTESLGSETGSNSCSSVDEFSYLQLGKKSSASNKPMRRTRELYRKTEFPPPLSWIGGNEGVKMLSHREGGRLVIEAFEVSSHGGRFEIDRQNGRLRLCFVKGNGGVGVEKDCSWCGRRSSGLRCGGYGIGSKAMPCLPFCVAIS